MSLKSILPAALFALAATTAMAQAPAMPVRVSGTIVTFDGGLLSIRTDKGADETLKLSPDLRVTALVNRQLSDINAGDYVGSAAVAGPDGKLHAQEVHIFASNMRGAGEGHRPMAGPNQSMTNATVTTVLADPTGHTLRLTYPGGEQDIEVGSDARIVQIVPGDRSLLKPGAAVSLFVSKAADGTPTVRSIQAEKDGVKPL
ncbi:hypothetical protein OSH11_17730 [Kaistia dalseonensis]|uniref:DUF5666 domain-containing protein n=1 Tax=Kaistia dalseonensis TaxID=410840 RepID=A0ABU0HA42_9HYPH|nr:hypothetical protein [Kaistia dalseonensis]MCX5496550.1 hypothetical protein [Kaistia dalseonensis]MDQ0439172.1 hypothetical protein [Kaistia dalseonensis]